MVDITTLPFAEELARTRIEFGPEHAICQEGYLVKESVLYVPGQFPILIHDISSFVKDLSAITEVDAKGETGYYPKNREIAKLVKQAEKDKWVHPTLRNVSMLEQLSCETVFPTKNLGKSEFNVGLFRAQAEEYGEFLRKQGIKEMPAYFVPYFAILNLPRAFAKHLLISSVNCKSAIL